MADGRKTYEVWFDAGWPESRLAHKILGSDPQFPDEYLHVANVRANALSETVELMTDKGGFLSGTPLKAWERNAHVEVVLPVTRDISPGDVIVAPGGDAYRYELGKFEEVGKHKSTSAGYEQEVMAAASRPRTEKELER